MKENIYQKLAAVMKDVSYVQKEDKKVNNQYTFVSHDAVTSLVRKAFIDHGIVSIPRVISHDQDGNRTTVDIQIDFVNIDNPEDKIIVPCFGYGIDSQDKGVGKAISYAVKYAYLKVLALETGDDPERDNIDHKPEPVKYPDGSVGLNLTPAEAKVKYADSIKCIQESIARGDYSLGSEAWYELTDAEKAAIWTAKTKGGSFSQEEKKVIKSNEWREAHYKEDVA